MLKFYHIYVTGECSYCVEAVKILNESGYEYALTFMDKSPELRTLLKKKYKWDTIPIIVECSITGEETLVGGCSDLKKMFSELCEDHEDEDEDSCDPDGIDACGL